jgi:predicted lipoprotein with Yx(FWY)xxD motif
MSDDSSAAHATARRPQVIATAVALGLLAVLAVLALRPGASEASPAKAGAVVSTAHPGIGTILVNSRGHTLYMFAKDRNGKSSCNGRCATFLAAADLDCEGASSRRRKGVADRKDAAC